ncbi:MAG TPA: hypothetical protein VF914_18470 [Chloroflexia bacterium]
MNRVDDGLEESLVAFTVERPASCRVRAATGAGNHEIDATVTTTLK